MGIELDELHAPGVAAKDLDFPHLLVIDQAFARDAHQIMYCHCAVLDYLLKALYLCLSYIFLAIIFSLR